MENVNHFEKANQMVENNSEMFGKFLTFLTDNQLFAIPISYVVQIVGIQEITELPDSPHYVKGIIGLRGSIILVIDNSYLTGIAKIDGKVVLLMDASKILSNDIITNFEDQIEGGSLL